MFVIFSTMFLFSFFIQFPLGVWNLLFRSDCYESFTNPPIYLNVTHDYPTGPLYLNVLFSYKRYSILPNYEIETENMQYNFKIIDKLCNSSILYTTMGEDLEKLYLEINIYTFNRWARIAHICYNFYKDFVPGKYDLINNINSFSVNLEIPEADDVYLTSRIKLFDENVDYIKSISKGNVGELCIISLAKILVIKPKYRFGIPSGLIYAITVDFEQNLTNIEAIKYPAFECKMHKKYKKEPVVFIKNTKKDVINCKVLYIKHRDGKLYDNWHKFEINSPKYEYFYNIKNISPKYSLIFLLSLKLERKNCPDGSESIVFYFQEYLQVISGINKFVNISTAIKRIEYLPRNTSHPCEE